jgi:hypothetical protein
MRIREASQYRFVERFMRGSCGDDELFKREFVYPLPFASLEAMISAHRQTLSGIE